MVVTVTEHVAETSPQWAVIVALPMAIEVTLPFASTVAIAELLEDHSTVLSVASSGKTGADSVTDSPTFNST